MSRDFVRQSLPIARTVNATTTRPVVNRITVSSAASSLSSFSAPGDDVADSLSGGITGSAMTVPPPKPVAQRTDSNKSSGSPRKAVTSSKSDSLTCDVRLLKEANDRSRELKEALAREKHQVKTLLQLIESLRAELADVQLSNAKLQDELKQTEVNFNELLEKERKIRLIAEEDAAHKAEQLQVKDDTLNLYSQQISDLNELVKKLQTEIVDLNAEKDREISSRDVKLERLKQQMSNALQGNSWQRQQQLDELNKELIKAQEEADLLRTTLRNANKNSCSNCEKLSARLSKLEVVATAGDKTITNLKELVAAHDKQIVDNSATNKSTAVATASKSSK